MFLNKMYIVNGTWQAFERNLSRLLMYEGFINVRLVGQTGDHGADVIATKAGKRWLFQAKHWKKKVGMSVVDEVMKAAREYDADIPVIVSTNGFDTGVYEYQRIMLARGIPLQLWDSELLLKKAKKLETITINRRKPRPYQDTAIKEIVGAYFDKGGNQALVVMATGLGKTFVAAESIRRIRNLDKVKILVCAHTQDLVYQLERAFWPFLLPDETTLVWNSYERPTYEQLEYSDYIFACVDSVANCIDMRKEIPDVGILCVDECHHAGSPTYDKVFDYFRAGEKSGSFALGLTATPWRADEINLEQYFGPPRVCIDTIMGLKNGFLANVDYRMYTDNINWDALKNIEGHCFSPRQINRTLFINQWDDAVVYCLRDAWKEQPNPRAIVFCATIEHAKVMCDKLNLLGFCNSVALYSGIPSEDNGSSSQYRRNKILSDFADGKINVICAVDIFNEGIDVPDVNILVFQRVTHSRRIFIQQLGRGLRVSEGKDKVIVLDFVSDIRRFAAGLSLKNSLVNTIGHPVRIDLPHTVKFMKVGGEDKKTENFLREWLDDVIAIENAGEDVSILRFPPQYGG